MPALFWIGPICEIGAIVELGVVVHELHVSRLQLHGEMEFGVVG